MKLYNLSHILKYNRRMKLNQISKFVPNLFYNQSDQIQFQQSVKTSTPFKQVNNTLKYSAKKSNRKGRAQKKFIEEEQNNQKNTKQNQIHESTIEISRQQNNQSKQKLSIQQKANSIQSVNYKNSKLLLHFDMEDSSDAEQQKIQENSQGQVNSQMLNLPMKNFDKLQLLDWSNSSSNSGNQTPIKVQKVQILPQKTEIKSINITRKGIFQKLEEQQNIQCMLRRDKKSSSGFIEYNIYLKSNSTHIVTVRKQGHWRYCLYLRQKLKNQTFYKYIKIAVLDSSFFGNKFTLIKQNQRYSNITICYETNILGLGGPRKISTYIPKIPLPYQYLHESYEDLKYREQIQKCVSRTPSWSQKSKSYVLDFKGRANESSIKNFVITDKSQSEFNNFIIFGKASSEVYNLDIQYPFSIIQGIAVAITSFERKITCD